MDVLDLHKKGTTGQGTVVAVIDTGIDTQSSDLADRISDTSVHITDLSENYDDGAGHGTNMSSLIASTGAESGLVGMAPGAELMVIRSDRDHSVGIPYASLVNKGIKFAANKGADVINLSLSSDNLGIINAITYAVSQGSIVTIATGNNGRYSDPSTMAYEVGKYGETALAVTAVNSQNEIALFAAPCDVSDPRFCFTAPGDRLAGLDINGKKAVISGTSAATAVVSGGIALMRQHFPNLTPEEIVEILLSTTQDLGEKGVDRVYGSGLVDFVAAMRPVGTVTVAALGSEINISASRATIGAAFGDGLAEVPALKALHIKDAYDRDFNIDLQSSLTISNRAAEIEELDLLADMRVATQTSKFGDMTLAYSSVSDTPLTEAVEDDWFFSASFDAGADGQFRFASTNTQREMGSTQYNLYSAQSDPMKSPFSLSGDRFTSLSYQTNLGLGQFKTRVELIEEDGFGLHNANSLVSLGFETHPLNGFRANATLSALNEEGAILGTKFSGVFGDIANTQSIAATLGASYQAKGYDLFVSGSLGTSSVDMKRAGLVTDFQDVTFSQWNMGIGFDSVLNREDRLAFGFGQPVRIEGGKAVFFDDSKHNLRPSGRELNAEMSYRARLENTDIAASLLYGSNIGNVTGKNDHVLGAFMMSWTF